MAASYNSCHFQLRDAGAGLTFIVLNLKLRLANINFYLKLLKLLSTSSSILLILLRPICIIKLTLFK